MGIRGRDGLALTEHWADGPKTFLGLQTAGFPNLFFPGGPHAAAGNNPRYNGDQVDFVTDTLVYVRDHGYDTIEVSAEAEERWTDMVDRGATLPSAFGESSYYFGTNIPGKPPHTSSTPAAARSSSGDRAGGRHRLRGVPAVPLRLDARDRQPPRSGTRFDPYRRRIRCQFPGLGYTVATGVSGEPTTPGRRSGGAVSRNRLRSCSRSQAASSCRYHISPRGTPSLNRQRWWIGRNECRLGSRSLPSSPSTA